MYSKKGQSGNLFQVTREEFMNCTFEQLEKIALERCKRSDKTEEYRNQVYQKWLESGRPWFNKDRSLEPTYAEKQIILEMKKRESN